MTVKDAEPTHGQEEEDGAYLRRRVRLLEREVSRLQETVKRLTMERTERAAEVLSNDSEEQEVRITSTRGMKGNAPGAPTGAIIAPPPIHGQRRAVSAVPTGWGVM